MSILDQLVERNELPVLFIGSGIPLRYINGFPSWSKLLLQLWNDVGRTDEDFHRTMLAIQRKLKSSITNDKEITYRSNLQIASQIESLYNEKYFAGEVTVQGVTAAQLANTQGNPFKFAVANHFKNINRIDGMSHELESFKKLLSKSRAIITTNYDEFIEKDLLGDEYNVFSSQADIFMSETNCGDVYKIHGSIQTPDGIVITESDYADFENNSALISAKLMMFLMESPLIFLGYSLSDFNISKIFSRFSRSLRSDQLPKLSERIIYVQYGEGLDSIEESSLASEQLGIQYTVLKTDNFQLIFDTLGKIDQGVPVAYIRHFNSYIRELIIERGRRGTLKPLLISPVDITDKSNIDDDKLVVAIGNNTTIFNFPTRHDYFKDYLKEKQEFPTGVALRFIAATSLATRLPIYKFTREINLDECDLNPTEKEKIKQRLANFSYDGCLRTIQKAHRLKCSSVKEACAKSEYLYKQIDIISFNIERIPQSDVLEYMQNYFKNFSFKEWKKSGTHIGRLITLWDYKYNRI